MATSQALRLFNVAVVGPAMFVGAFALRRRMPWLGYSLGALGLFVVGENALNHRRYEAVVSSVHVGPATMRPSA